MNKVLVLLILSAYLITPTYAQDYIDTLTQFSKVVVSHKSTYSSGSKEIHFFEDGKRYKSEEYHNDTLITRFEFEYNSDGYLASQERHSKAYSHNPETNETIGFFVDGMFELTTYIYDSNRLTLIQDFDIASRQVTKKTKTVNSYDNHNRMTKEVETDFHRGWRGTYKSNEFDVDSAYVKTSNSTRSKTFEYLDDYVKTKFFIDGALTGYQLKKLKGDTLINQTWFDKNMDSLRTEVYRYDYKNRLSEIEIRDISKKHWWGGERDIAAADLIRLNYNSDGYIIRMVTIFNGEIIGESIFEYEKAR